MLAAAGGHVPMVEYLLKLRVEVNATDVSNYHTFVYAYYSTLPSNLRFQYDRTCRIWSSPH